MMLEREFCFKYIIVYVYPMSWIEIPVIFKDLINKDNEDDVEFLRYVYNLPQERINFLKDPDEHYLYGICLRPLVSGQ